MKKDSARLRFDPKQKTTVRPAGSAKQKIKVKPAGSEKQDACPAGKFKMAP